MTRTCAAEGCETILSRYNESSVCSRCDDPMAKRAGVPHDVHLTAAELRVLLLVARGHSNVEIAAELFISIETAKTHVRTMVRKLDAKSRSQAVWIALELGLIEPPVRATA